MLLGDTPAVGNGGIYENIGGTLVVQGPLTTRMFMLLCKGRVLSGHFFHTFCVRRAFSRAMTLYLGQDRAYGSWHCVNCGWYQQSLTVRITTLGSKQRRAAPFWPMGLPYHDLLNYRVSMDVAKATS